MVMTAAFLWAVAQGDIVELHRDNFEDALASHEELLVHFYTPCACC